MQFGNTRIQDKALAASRRILSGNPHEALINEYLTLPLKNAIREKWLYRNTARVFGFS